MNDNDYKDVKELFDKKEYEAKKAKYLDNNDNYNVFVPDKRLEVKHKNMETHKKSELIKKVASFIVAGMIAATSIVMVADIINHPEGYLTTHPDFKGAPTISQVIERTPDNFGINRK